MFVMIMQDVLLNFFYIEVMLICCPALDLFHSLPLWKTVLFVSSRAFSLSTPTFLLSTPVEHSEATWKKATKCNNQLLVNFSLWWFMVKTSPMIIIEFNYSLVTGISTFCWVSKTKYEAFKNEVQSHYEYL